ncbi:unnamed protein product [Caenorhabditis bovis]|uniref:glutaminase n=1 Tax=Caenorhabditis bovis TaxID=2654633 RepID=A0A8S1F9K5_9PELO|nr:unnamed protein product [Caenorhabditis bovis]
MTTKTIATLSNEGTRSVKNKGVSSEGTSIIDKIHAAIRLIENNMKFVEYDLLAQNPRRFEELKKILLKVNKLTNRVVIPVSDESFKSAIDRLAMEFSDEDSGEVASYIPKLAEANPKDWAVSICTVNGETHSFGDHTKSFSLQSVSKVFMYALTYELIGVDKINERIGTEPSGRPFNSMDLDQSNKPFNPMVNAGAIMLTSLYRPKEEFPDRYRKSVEGINEFAYPHSTGYDHLVYLSEIETAHINRAISYRMLANKAFAADVDIEKNLAFYTQNCAMTATTDVLAVMGATLANSGVNPISKKRVISENCCRDTLTIMSTCGLYDYSGEFAFKIGLPAKSGVSGALLIVVPEVMSIAMYSPKLDTCGNSVRGIKFAEKLVQCFNLHPYENFTNSLPSNIDPGDAQRQIQEDSQEVPTT